MTKARGRLEETARAAGGAEALAALEASAPPPEGPFFAKELEKKRWQIEGLWRDDELNHMRAELFAAAMALHQSWVAEADWNGNLFGISRLLGGGAGLSRDSALVLWQSLFMMVPVLSTTLASVSRQFHHLEGGDLGWLLFDEAGQASPQSAVGALWRTKRAVVVGDPLQIEPVFTVPVGIVKRLAGHNGIEENRQVSPHRTSAQVLADAANPMGGWLKRDGERLWLGSPLRVHRRCRSPMFDLSNRIAYAGKMIQAVEPAAGDVALHGIDPGPSAWVDLGGESSGRHFVAAQAVLVREALLAWQRATGSLPPLYIVTPFREVRSGLHDTLKENVPKAWLKRNLGTVHTFQGKEQEMVWLVLGCTRKSLGAAHWAASRPNLLNVALTRARKRFFLIGDRDLWGGLPHFCQIGKELPSCPPDEFLARISRRNP